MTLAQRVKEEHNTTMSRIPPELGKKVSTRNFNWLDLVQRAWGSEFTAPDHGTYEWSNGRKFDSTDRGLTGLYGVEVMSPIEAEYPVGDMDTTIQLSHNDELLFSDNPGENLY